MSRNSSLKMAVEESNSVVDSAYLQDFFDGNSVLIEKMAAVFMQTYSSYQSETEQLFAASDQVEIRRWVHTLKSSARYVGAVDLSEMCERQQSAIDSGDGATAEDLNQLVLELGAVVDTLSDES